MKIKNFLSVLAIVGAVSTISITAHAENIGFDPAYYAAEYPDVVAAFGTDGNLLYQHYVAFGIKEGRYQNQWEEDNGIVNSSNIQITTSKYDVQPIAGYSTYVDVDISDQVVTYFENGVIALQSDCVSGLDNGKRNTPCGTYRILTKTPGKYLKGKTWNCWVNRWMRFTNSSIGLHDASWRSSFGGNIYKTNGSHGCVNLPKDMAYSLYDRVNVGTIVVVHE